MSLQGYKTQAIVLKKTKLSESDLIVSFLCKDGSLLRAVAKGARKPASNFSARLELCSFVELFLAKGKNLDVVKEARLLNSYNKIRLSIEKFSCVSLVIELLEKTSQQNLKDKNLFPLTLTFFDFVVNEKRDIFLNMLCLAHLIKTCSFLGFRPCFQNCSVCGDDMSKNLEYKGIPFSFSIEEGGLVCMRCSRNLNCSKIISDTIFLMHNLIHTKFVDISLINTNNKTIKQAFEILKKWIIYHIGVKIKSLDFYTLGLS